MGHYGPRGQNGTMIVFDDAIWLCLSEVVDVVQSDFHVVRQYQ